MIKKIYWTIFLVIVFVALFILGNQIIISQFRVSTEKLLLEYKELYNLQEFRTSVVQFQNYIFENHYNDITLASLDSILIDFNENKSNCEKYVTKFHLDEEWHELLIHYGLLISFFEKEKLPSALDPILEPAEKIDSILNLMIIETSDEIDVTIRRNKTIQKHGSLTVLLTGFLFLIVIFLVIFSTAKGITGPIQEFLKTFKKLEAGDKEKRVEIKGKDEFATLAKEFNELFDKLNSTTVTLEYVRNIMDNIFGALFVTEQSGIIKSCNLAATKLLGYDEAELIGKQVTTLFNPSSSSNDNYSSKLLLSSNEDLIHFLKNASEIITDEGKHIPVMNTCTELSTNDEKGLIIVSHDISEKIEYEKQLQDIKREHLILFSEAQEAERTRIASDLHDGLGQKLSAISYSIQNLNEKGEKGEKLEYLQKMINEVIAETRSISHSIVPAELKDFGLIPALNEMINTYNSVQQDIHFSLNHFGFKDRIDNILEKTIFRICQEALSNIVKHSQAKKAFFQIFKAAGMITITVEDDGIGFDQEKIQMKDKGIGLLGIKERIFPFKGEFTLNSAPGKGTELIIEIPYKN